jgi:hypothetical protein
MTNEHRARELIAYLRRSAKGSSEAQRIMAEAKSARQADGGTYGWPTPEGTIEWEIADLLEATLRSRSPLEDNSNG